MSPSPHTQPTDARRSASTLRGLMRSLVLGLVLASAVWAAWQLDLARYMSVAGMRALVDAHAHYGPLVFMAIVVAGLFTRLPMMGTVLVAVGAVLFGRLPAFAYGWLAALVGTTAIFLLVRSVARDYVQRTLDARSGWLRAIDERVARNGFRTVLVLRLVFGLAPMLNWGLGLTGVRLPHYVAATALGIAPNLAVAVFFADAIVSRLPGSGISSPLVVVGGTLVVVAIATAGVARRLRRKRANEAARAAILQPDGSRRDGHRDQAGREDAAERPQRPGRQAMSSLRNALVEQFGRPSGLLGRLVGFIMRVRPSNRERNLRTVALLDIRPDDEVLEVGFGPGLAIERAAALTSRGKVVGIDHSELMLREARRRNAKAIEVGRVELLLGSADRLPDYALRFDKVFAVNVYMFWDDPVSILRGLRGAMKPGGTILLTLQPRNRGATNEDAREAADRMASSLRGAGFENVRIEILTMSPVDAACVFGQAATAW